MRYWSWIYANQNYINLNYLLYQLIIYFKKKIKKFVGEKIAVFKSIFEYFVEQLEAIEAIEISVEIIELLWWLLQAIVQLSGLVIHFNVFLEEYREHKRKIRERYPIPEYLGGIRVQSKKEIYTELWHKYWFNRRACIRKRRRIIKIYYRRLTNRRDILLFIKDTINSFCRKSIIFLKYTKWYVSLFSTRISKLLVQKTIYENFVKQKQIKI